VFGLAEMVRARTVGEDTAVNLGERLACELAVQASIAWHEAWMRAFGCRTATDDDVWRLIDPPPRDWYFTAISRRPETPATAVANAAGMVCDSWSRLDLQPLGFEPREAEPWFYRPAGPLPPDERPVELEIVRASTPEEIGEFEAASVRGFESEDARVEPGTVHPAAILDDPRMSCWMGRAGGRPVAAATSYRTRGAIGIFGVTTLASARERGYGTAITRAAVLAESGLPSVLSPSPQGEDLYRRLGFRTVGALRKWWHSPSGATRSG
jgi:hypothetical protein